MTEIRLPYVHYPDEGLKFEDPSLTKQSFADECDFNAVMGRWERTGTIEHVNTAIPQFSDVSALPDYQAALNTVIAANAAFEALPSGLRERFSNDPAQLVAFLENADNKAEAVKLGLIVDKSERASDGAGVDLSTKPPKAAAAAPSADPAKQD
nr:MAG: internal scaffolding protein [Microvirus sp.]